MRDIVVNYNLEPGSTLRTINIARKYPQIFDWLNILDMNVFGDPHIDGGGCWHKHGIRPVCDYT